MLSWWAMSYSGCDYMGGVGGGRCPTETRKSQQTGIITGSTVALHHGKAHVQGQWEGANFDPQWHQNPRNFSNLNLASARSTPVQSLISIRSAGASPQIGEILRHCDFFPGWLVILFLFLSTRPVRTRGRLMTHMTCFGPQKTALLGVVTILEFIWGNIPKIPQQ